MRWFKSTYHHCKTKAEKEGYKSSYVAEVATDTRCGTYAGHGVHLRRQEPPCEDCQEAKKAYMREYARERRRKIREGVPTSRNLQPCGTPAAYRRHKKAGEEPCDLCIKAMRVDKRKQKRIRLGIATHEAFDFDKCGTLDGILQHRHYGERLCQLCQQFKEYQENLVQPSTEIELANENTYGNTPVECGTLDGYYQHKRYKEAVCSRCMKAKKKHVKNTRTIKERHSQANFK